MGIHYHQQIKAQVKRYNVPRPKSHMAKNVMEDTGCYGVLLIQAIDLILDKFDSAFCRGGKLSEILSRQMILNTFHR